MITHPFIGDLTSKSMDDLMESISKLSKQQQYMFRIGNHNVVNQINMALNSYRAEYQRRQQEIWDKKSTEMNKKIDIS